MKILKFEKVNSTQKIAKKLAKEGKKEWTVILAKEQTGGIGRKGNFWYSPKGGLYFSVILPKIKIEKLKILTDFIPLLISKIIFEEFKEKPFVKFPNDIYLKGKKIGGVMIQNLISGKGQISILGVGLNTNIKKFPEDLREKATSLLLEFKKRANNERIFKKILKELQKVIKEFQNDGF
jgi:BirA family biotin operon repressor/biotin-[acetyl-CoA-carboxylase] ligase